MVDYSEIIKEIEKAKQLILELYKKKKLTSKEKAIIERMIQEIEKTVKEL